MFDFHAHYGSDNDNALVNILTEEQWGYVKDLKYVAVGLLPWHDENVPGRIRKVLEENPHALVGEIGLDRRMEEYDYQRQVFHEMLEIARDLKRPVIIHSVGTTEECLNILKDMGIEYAIFHSYGSSYELAKKIVDAGYDISLNRRCFHIRDYDRIRQLPYLLETDLETGPRQKLEIQDIYSRLATAYQVDRKRDIWKDSF